MKRKTFFGTTRQTKSECIIFAYNNNNNNSNNNNGNYITNKQIWSDNNKNNNKDKNNNNNNDKISIIAITPTSAQPITTITSIINNKHNS